MKKVPIIFFIGSFFIFRGFSVLLMIVQTIIKGDIVLKTFILSLQHVLAMYAGAVIVPILVAQGLGLTGEQTTYLVSVDIFMCGIATFLQVYRGKFTGIGLPVVLGCTFTAVAPMITIGKTAGLATMYGSIFISGLVVILIAPIFAKVAKLFPPVVTGSVVTIIGITLVPVAMKYIAGGEGASDFGNPKYVDRKSTRLNSSH